MDDALIEYVWHDAPVPDGLPVTQVYGWLLCPATGRVLIQHQEGGAFSLPGGRPEPFDADMAAAPATLGWGAPAEAQARSATRAGRRWGLPVDSPAADGYED